MFDSRDAFREFVSAAVDRFEFFEFVILNSRVYLNHEGDPDAAVARMYMSELRQDHAERRWTAVYGVYHDQFSRIDGRWWYVARNYSSLARPAHDVDSFPFPDARTVLGGVRSCARYAFQSRMTSGGVLSSGCDTSTPVTFLIAETGKPDLVERQLAFTMRTQSILEMLNSSLAATPGSSVTILRMRALAQAEHPHRVAGGVDVERPRALEQERHLAEHLAGADHPDDLLPVAGLQRAVEHHEDVAGHATLLQHPVADRALDDVAVAEAAFDLLVGEPVERRDVLRLDLVHRGAEVQRVVVGAGHQRTHHRAAAAGRGSARRSSGISVRAGADADAAERVGALRERDQRDEVARLGRVDVLGRSTCAVPGRGTATGGAARTR